MSYVPITIDGHEIPSDAPRGSFQSDEHAAAVSEAADEFRAIVLHCHFDLVGRDITLNAANAPQGTVVFTFGDGSADVEQQITGEGGSASATHTYLTDGVFTVGIYTPTDRWTTQAAVNWPPPPPEGP